MVEQITFPADNSTFTIGNTTYVWDDPPGIWRAYTVGDFSGGGGSGGDPICIPYLLPLILSRITRNYIS